MTRWVLALPLFALIAGCSPREPRNPLDPQNPATGGQPRWLAAVADRGAVDLDWSVPLTYQDLDEVWLVRTNDGELLWRGGQGENTFRDTPRPDGIDVGYRLELQTASGGTTTLPTEIATPGPAIAWVVDDGAQRVRRLAPDARTVRFSLPQGNPLTLDTDPDSGAVVVASFFGGTVEQYGPDGTLRWSLLADSPATVLRTGDGWWVGDAGTGAVVLLDETGSVIFGDSTFVFPVDLAPAGPRAVWVVDRWGEVARVDADEDSTRLRLPYDTPIAVAAASGGGAWIAVRGTGAMVRLDAQGTEVARADGFAGVIDLEPDPVIQFGVWGADRQHQAVILLDATGVVLTSFPVVAPATLDVSPDGSEIWVADPAENRVIRFARDGRRIAVSQGVSSPTSISVAWDPAVP